MENKKLEYKMCFFTLSQLSDIDKGIQCGYAALIYANDFGKTEQFINYINDWNEWIIFNGKTTGNKICGIDRIGYINQIVNQLDDNNINYSSYFEKKLNFALTTICFIVDERIYNKFNYPEFVDYLIDKISIDNKLESSEFVKLKITKLDDLILKYNTYYNVGGEQNVFLRNLLVDKELIWQ